MNKLFTETQFEEAKSRDLLPLKCEHCSKTFHKKKHRIQDVLAQKTNRKTFQFCSNECSKADKFPKNLVNCDNCGKEFHKEKARQKNRNFCCQSCANSYNTQNKKHGTRRSKLEVWLESQLSSRYPDLEFHFNRKDAIQSELDIYIPSLSLAFELNGIFHYEPIYGLEKLASIQNNDARKFQACLERNIELCILDVSQMNYFKESKATKFLDIICSIIDPKLTVS